jgi:hypothetical protein
MALTIEELAEPTIRKAQAFFKNSEDYGYFLVERSKKESIPKRIVTACGPAIENLNLSGKILKDREFDSLIPHLIDKSFQQVCVLKLIQSEINPLITGAYLGIGLSREGVKNESSHYCLSIAPIRDLSMKPNNIRGFLYAIRRQDQEYSENGKEKVAVLEDIKGKDPAEYLRALAKRMTLEGDLTTQGITRLDPKSYFMARELMTIDRQRIGIYDPSYTRLWPDGTRDYLSSTGNAYAINTEMQNNQEAA